MTEAAQNLSFQQQTVYIHSNGIVGILHQSLSKEIVVLCHSLLGSKEDITVKTLALALQNAGISCFRFDFNGDGESLGSFRFGSYKREVDALFNVNKFFRNAKRPVVAIVGHGCKGGNVVLLYASKYNDIKVVISLSARYDLKKGIERYLGDNFIEKFAKEHFITLKTESGIKIVTRHCLEDRLIIDMANECHQKHYKIHEDCRILTVHGSVDTIIPVEDAYQFNNILPNNHLHVIEGADHSFTNHQNELAFVVIKFLNEKFEI